MIIESTEAAVSKKQDSNWIRDGLKLFIGLMLLVITVPVSLRGVLLFFTFIRADGWTYLIMPLTLAIVCGIYSTWADKK